MTLADQITALVLTYNEADNIGRTLAALVWVPRILVIDSGSSDETLAIIARFPQAEVVTRAFDSFAAQCNFGLSQVASPWVLSLDADYVVSEALAREIETLTPPEEVSGFRASFIYRVYGRELRSSLYPPRTVLYRKDRARYRDVGHGHRVEIAGPVAAAQGAHLPRRQEAALTLVRLPAEIRQARGRLSPRGAACRPRQGRPHPPGRLAGADPRLLLHPDRQALHPRRLARLALRAAADRRRDDDRARDRRSTNSHSVPNLRRAERVTTQLIGLSEPIPLELPLEAIAPSVTCLL